MNFIEYNLLALKQMKNVPFYIVLLVFLGISLPVQARTEYEIRPLLDIPLTISAGVVALFGSYRLNKMQVEAKPFESSSLLPWDKPFAGTWNPNAGTAANAFTVLGLTPVALGVVGYFKQEVKGCELAALSLMFVQAMAIQSGLNLMTRSAKIWPRPFILGEDGGAERLKGEAYGSFYSGHSSAAFSVAVLTSVWFQNTYSSSKYTPYVWGASLSMATAIAVLRVAAGKHYPTDVLAGALVGSLVSIVVLKTHERNNNVISLQAGPNYLGVTRHF